MENNKLTSHDYAHFLQHAAEIFLSREAFQIPAHYDYSFNYFRFDNKDEFVAAVKALGPGKKVFSDDNIEFKIQEPHVSIIVEAPRKLLCRLIRPAEYECDPLLSPDEEKQLGGAA